MRRRRFVHAVTTVSAAAEVMAQQLPEAPRLSTVAAEPTTDFFSPLQFATLRHLSAFAEQANNINEHARFGILGLAFEKRESLV